MTKVKELYKTILYKGWEEWKLPKRCTRLDITLTEGKLTIKFDGYTVFYDDIENEKEKK